MTKKQFLYLLRDSNSADFKIGISANVVSRASLLPQDIDFDNSFYVDCTDLSARRIEQTIHTFFHKFRTSDHQGDGKTEWFKGECFNEVKDFLVMNADRFGCSHPKQLQKRQNISSIASSAFKPRVRETGQERYQRTLDEWERKRTFANELCTKIFQKCLEVLQQAFSSGALLGRGYMNNNWAFSDKEFLAFSPSLETSIWHRCTHSAEIEESCEPRITLYPMRIETDGTEFGTSRYSMLGLSCLNKKGLWHTFHRPQEAHMEEAPILRDWNDFLNSIPLLQSSQLTYGRRTLTITRGSLCKALRS